MLMPKRLAYANYFSMTPVFFSRTRTVSVGSALKLRYTPELVWALDDSITYGAKMLKLINSLEVKNDEQSDEA